MLYSINTIILDTRTNQLVDGAVVIDLYVNSEADANRNIFARDAMNLPVVKAGIQRYDETYHLPSRRHILPKYTVSGTYSNVSIRKATTRHIRQ